MPSKIDLKKIIEKGMYADALKENTTVSAILEREDPSENYKGSPLGELDAFQRQLVAHGINVNKANLEAFYDSTNRALFPEFINRMINLGKQIGKNEVMVNDIVAVRTSIEGGAYQAPTMEIDSSERRADIAEGASFPTVSITTGKRTVTLQKYGFCLKLSYEARRRASIAYLKNALLLMGRNWSIQQVELALTKAIASGCGSDTSAVAGTLSYNDLVDFQQNFSPYDSNLWIGDKATISKILKMTEFKDPQAGFKYQSTGEIMSPMGNGLKRFSGSTPDLEDLLVGLDKNFALEMITEKQSALVEVDKIINGQWDETDVSEVIGFSRMHDDAVRKLDYSS